MNNEQTPKTMKDRNVKQVVLRGGLQCEGKVNEEGKGRRICLLCFLHMFKYGTLKPVEFI
jgi:hypothetical protein